MKTVCIIGLGYIGLTFTAALANSGHKVIGLDIDKKKIEQLKKSQEPPFYEPGLAETLKKCKRHIEYTTDSKYAIENSEAIFVTVGTPLNEKEEPDYSFIDMSLKVIGENLKKGQIIILKSTVVLGTTMEHVKPKLEELSGLKAGEDFYLVFCPERTIEGLALHELYTLPKIIGGVNRASSEKASEILKRLGGKITITSTPEVAEMCKLIDNLYRSVNIAFANEIGELCEARGIDAGEVVSVVNASYPRTTIFKPGLGADGPCLSKDPHIFRYSTRKHNLPVHLMNSCITSNKFATMRIAEMIIDYAKANEQIKKPKVAFIGLAFKGFPETDDLRGSPAIKIHSRLMKENPDFEFRYYDPNVTVFLDQKTEEEMTEAMKDADIIVFLTNHLAISNLDSDMILDNVKRPCYIIDCWRNINDPEKIKKAKGIKYYRIGDGKK